MFSALHKDGSVALRLHQQIAKRSLKKYKTSLASHYGAVQPEYVVVPDKLLARRRAETWFAEVWRYVSSLKPKAPQRGRPQRRPPEAPPDASGREA
jgi:hypothetical protein